VRNIGIKKIKNHTSLQGNIFLKKWDKLRKRDWLGSEEQAGGQEALVP